MRYLLTGLMGFFFLSFLNSCQKEVSVENGAPAKGSLQSSAGECLPKTVAGSYIVNKALTDSNFIEVTVNVVTPGSYNISTDVVNGYSFKATGAFSAAGANTVRLTGSGKPINSGVNDFTVVFDSSSCGVSVTVLPSGSTGGPATYALQISGTACAPFTPSGNYIKDTTLDARHTVSVAVNVTAIGAYSITTNTVNGYSFSASGTFSSTGVKTVILQGAGKPLAAQTDNFTATAGTSTCTFPITVTATAPPPVSPCGITPQGSYTAGTVLAGTNKVVLTHNYTTAGSYTINTTTVNGYSFGPTTITATAGPNTITLNGVGTPAAAGTNTFTVNFGDGSSCTFTVTVSPAAQVVNNDHFPLTPNSWWSYDDSSTPGDSIKVTNLSATTFNGNSYRLFQYKDDAGPYDTSYFRRVADDYFEYRTADYYSAVPFDNPQRVDILFLKENTTTGTTWNSAVFPGTVSGQAINIRYVFTCADANATVTVNGKTFTNVYKITFKGQYNVTGPNYTDDGITWTAYYAKGVGLVNFSGTDGTNTYQLKIKSWVVF